jgi:hypothetical protein
MTIVLIFSFVLFALSTMLMVLYDLTYIYIYALSIYFACVFLFVLFCAFLIYINQEYNDGVMLASKAKKSK